MRTDAPRRVAVIGSGISGLSAAYRLADDAHVTLFEAGDYFGGHTHTVDVEVDTPAGRMQHGVDTGFLVYNERTYPKLIALFAELGVTTAESDMSFSVKASDPHLEWSGSSLNALFADRSNLVRPSFWRMLRDIDRFNRLCTAMAKTAVGPSTDQTIGEFLDAHAFSAAFREGYFLPMIGCIWSCPTEQMLAFPVATMIRFCHNHGLIQWVQRPRWFTVVGGARQYVAKLLERIPDARLRTPVRRVRRLPGFDRGGVLIDTDAGTEAFDDVVLACHSDESLALLADPSADERAVLGAVRYHPNRAVLHTDTSVLPRRQRAWAAWNYERAAVGSGREQAAVCLHYLINRLQPLPFEVPVIVTLNPLREPRAGTVQGDYAYSHPVFDRDAIAAQQRLPSLQGVRNTWYCGAWTRYGFHEDGLMSGLAVVEGLRAQWSQARLAAA